MKKVHISHTTIICLFIFFLNICGMMACIVGIYAYYHPQPISSFSEGSLKPGKYVSGTITSYVVSPLDKRTTREGDSYFGNRLDIWGRMEYIGYLIPFNEEQYIRIWIKDEKSLALLWKTPDGFHVNVPFTGRIERNDIPADYTDEMLGFDHNKVITDYVIFQRNLNTEMFWLKVCLTGMVISFLFYWFKGRVEMSQGVYGDKDSPRSSCYMDTPYVDISYEIVLVERRISLCEELKKEYRIGGCIGAVCLIIGVPLFVKLASFATLVISLFLIGYGTRKLWRYFINSQNSLAVFLARSFNLKTLQIEYMENCKLLDELNKKKKED
ncbi:MAG: hypothetical protein NC094_04105 [Bacteroidales bacterium]|nr:hypothetical protein [Lachnoclostridium sp.]MCM1383194.1 hypothetical protein [Lachnoclostridium sp.]MCM1464580.1 hypothetical protein [Bacteroidales bacterium]